MIPFNFVAFIAICVVGALALAGFVRLLIGVFRGRETPAAAPPPLPTSVSVLAGFSFFSGLAAISLVVISVVLLTICSMEHLLHLESGIREGVTLAAKIVLYVSLLPSVVAVAFALAARGVISEGAGAVRGRPLYRTGVLLAVLSGAVALDARVLNPSTWASALRVGQIQVLEQPQHRGYLGVELEGPGSVRVERVVPGSPAERAGIQPGDWIVELNGSATQTGAALTERIGALPPGSRVVLGLQRDTRQATVTAELTSSFETLHGMLKRQNLDAERLHVLKAAGVDHRYSADELTKICETFDLDIGRLSAIETSLPHLQDPQNAYRILGSLETAAAKEKASGWIAERSKAPKPSRDE